MPFFRKKPVVIEARQFDGTEESGFSIVEWSGGEVRVSSVVAGVARLLINTKEGKMTGIKGDWIIKGVTGEFYPCKPDIFEMTYDEIEDAA